MARTGRRPGAGGTREKILAAARFQFSEAGYEGATIRDIAGDAGVDPALVLHYFGSKEGVFVAAVEFPIDPAEVLPGLLAPGLEGLGERLVRFFLGAWDSPAGSPLLGLIRSVVGNERAAALVRDGEVVAAAQEERFTRKKHDSGFPRHAVDYCLAEAGVELEASQQRPCAPVLPQCRCGEQHEAVRAGPSHHPPGERGADSHPLQLLGDFERDLGDSGSINFMRVAAHPDDRAVAPIDRSECLVLEVIDIGEVGEFPGRQYVFWR